MSRVYDMYKDNEMIARISVEIDRREFFSSPDAMDNYFRALLSKFKTHCAVNGSDYQINHFGNWLNKYHGITMRFVTTNATRVDM